MYLFAFYSNIYALNRDLNEEFWLGKFIKNEKILCSYGETGRNETKQGDPPIGSGEFAGLP